MHFCNTTVTSLEHNSCFFRIQLVRLWNTTVLSLELNWCFFGTQLSYLWNTTVTSNRSINRQSTPTADRNSVRHMDCCAKNISCLILPSPSSSCVWQCPSAVMSYAGCVMRYLITVTVVSQ